MEKASDSLYIPKSSHFSLWPSGTALEPQLSPVTHLIFLQAHSHLMFTK